MYPNNGSNLAEMEGFEPPHALRRLADFESAPFSHLGTSPETWLLYQRRNRKSRLMLRIISSFCKFQNSLHTEQNRIIIPRIMRKQAGAAVLNIITCIAESAAATIPKSIQRTIAEQAVEGFRICTSMAGKIFAGFILIKFITFHRILPEWSFQSLLTVL